MAVSSKETLEQRIAARNGLTFFREFTFAKNGFRPTPETTGELADNIIWMEDYLCLIQLKQRVPPTDDPVTEGRWFDKNVLYKGTRQIRDGLAYLDTHPEITITNEKGDAFVVRRTAVDRIDKIVLYEGGKALDADRRRITHHISRTAGFIHILSLDDYVGVMDVLITPGDVRRYLDYREQVLTEHTEALEGLTEASLLGHYVGGDPAARPTADSVLHLGRLIQDVDDFDMSAIVARLSENVVRSGDVRSYYSIMLELARLPRSGLRQFKMRFGIAMGAARDREWRKPYRFYFPDTDCAFMITAMHPDVPDQGAEGIGYRINALKNFTMAAKYDAKARRGLGVLIAKVGEFYEIEWCFVNAEWVEEPEIEDWLVGNSPFRPVAEREVDGFLLVTDD